MTSNIKRATKNGQKHHKQTKGMKKSKYIMEKKKSEEKMKSLSSALSVVSSPSCKEFLLRRFGGYQLLDINLGKGSFARVELATHLLTNTKVALKIINLNDITEPYTQKHVLRESTILKTLRHKNIVQLYETLAHHNTYCFVTEYLEGGNLYNHMHEQKQKTFTEKQARSYFIQLLYAVQYLHRKGIIHRDLKLQNIMLNKSKKQIKLVDFGLSSYYNKDELLKTRCGSTKYAAPELFDKGANYGPSIEIWSISLLPLNKRGVILFVMTTGKMPFQAQSQDKRENFIVQIRKGMSIAHENILRNLSADLKKLLIGMLEPDLDKRIDLTKVMSNVWVTEHSKNPLLSQPSDVVPHEVRQKVIERVAELYSKTVSDTIKDLNVNQFDAMHATYQILLDKSICVQRSHSVQSSSSLTKRDAKKTNDLTKYSSRSTSARSSYGWTSRAGVGGMKQSVTSATKRYARPQSARPDRRMKSTLDNLKNKKFCHSPCDKNDSLVLMDCDDDDSFVETLNDKEANIYVHPVTSCLKITKKSPCYDKRSKTYTPPCNSFFSRSDLQQTPFRLSKPKETTKKPKVSTTAGRTPKGVAAGKIPNDRDWFVKKGFQTTETNVIESTIEGVFEFNSGERDAGDEAEDKVSVESDQIRVVISGHKISSGSFKIVHGSNKKAPVRKHCEEGTTKRSSDRKPCVRCLSPYEARLMLHRDTFPVKQTFMKPIARAGKTVVAENSNTSTKHKEGFFVVNKEPPNQPVAEKRLYDETITSNISTPDSLISIPNNNKQSGKSRSTTTSSASRCPFKVANEILAHENNMNSQTPFQKSRAASFSIGQKYNCPRRRPARRVSFKE